MGCVGGINFLSLCMAKNAHVSSLFRYSMEPFAAANGQIPQLNIWDDHDVCLLPLLLTELALFRGPWLAD